MVKQQFKKAFSKAQASIVLIIVAAVLSQVFHIVQYFYSRHTIKQQTIEQTYRDLKEMQRIVNLKTNVETAVENAMGDVLINLQEPDKFYGIVSRLVARNQHVVGSAIAMEPCFYPQKDSLFAPFAYPESKDGKGQPRTKLLPYDYTKEEWYLLPYKADSAIWSEPYIDKGGSELLIHTYGKPIHDSRGRIIGILTADVHFKDLAKAEDSAYDDIDKVNILGFILQLIGLLLVIWIVWRYTKEFRKVNSLLMEQGILNKELQIASDIQSAMLPNISHEENARHHLDIQGCLVPAPDVSADFYDYFYIGTKIVFCIGDVPGSNVKAALMMSIARSVFRTAATVHSNGTNNLSPAAIVASMNHAICTINHNQMFSTILVGVLDHDNAILRYCSAGNPSPVILSPSTGATLLDTEPNIPIGVVDDFEYKEQEITLINDFILFLYNDGLYETENNKHEPFGQKRMLTRLNKLGLSKESPEKVLSKMKEVLEDHRGEAPQTDDILMVALKII